MKKYNFLIQIDSDGQIMHDFGFTLLQSIKFDKWWSQDDTQYKYSLVNEVLSIDDKFINIPIGSVEFVLDFYKKHHNIKNIKPINIPRELSNKKYLKRNLITDISKIDREQKVFVKSMDKLKDYTDIIKVKNISTDKNLLISELIEIDSEWRAFVYNKKLLDIKNYSGEFELFPDIKIIKEMIEDYKDNPMAYTLDVGINKEGTFLIEVHHFFSCGLYGFSDYNNLPKMFIRTHFEILNGFYD